jgi:hypothetical protein
MPARQTPPDGYARAGLVSLENDPKVRRTVLLAGLLWTVPCVALICGVAGSLRPLMFEFDGRSGAGKVGALVFIVGLALSGLVAMVLHEAVHGVFLWRFTKTRPDFGYRGWYAYAGAPGWYFSRPSFLVALLAPFVALTAVAFALYFVLPATSALLALSLALFNAIGSIGDLYLCARLLGAPRSSVVEDRADGIAWWVPGVAEADPAAEGQAAT